MCIHLKPSVHLWVLFHLYPTIYIHVYLCVSICIHLSLHINCVYIYIYIVSKTYQKPSTYNKKLIVIYWSEICVFGSKHWKPKWRNTINMRVSWDRGTPQSSISMALSLINQLLRGTPIYGHPHICSFIYCCSIHSFIEGCQWTTAGRCSR